VIGLLSRAITELSGSFLLVLGPTFSALLTNKSLLTNALGTYFSRTSSSLEPHGPGIFPSEQWTAGIIGGIRAPWLLGSVARCGMSVT
jgi:hypothetical protein